MKRRIITIMTVALALCGCAVSPTGSQYDSTKKSFDGWAKYQMAKAGEIWSQTELGSYIIFDKEPSGAPLVGDAENAPYLYVEYTSSGLDGAIKETTDRSIAKRLGMDTTATYYGPVVWDRSGTVTQVLSAGLDEAVSTMSIGGHRKVAIPKWLSIYGRYKKESDYLKNSKKYKTYDDEIVDIHIVDCFTDPEKWQIDSLDRYLKRVYGRSDTLQYGLFYARERAGKDVERKNGDTISVEYTGRLLNGNVFDTNIQDTAMVYNMYNRNSDYYPMELVWNENSSEITIAGSNNPVTGFSYIVQRMKPGEKGTVIFYYKLGYGIVNQGSTIPAYSTLSFTIEMKD